MLFKMQLPLICITDGFAYYHPFNICIKKSIKSVGCGSLQRLYPALSLPPAHCRAHAVIPQLRPLPIHLPWPGLPPPGLESGSADQQPP